MILSGDNTSHLKKGFWPHFLGRQSSRQPNHITRSLKPALSAIKTQRNAIQMQWHPRSQAVGYGICRDARHSGSGECAIEGLDFRGVIAIESQTRKSYLRTHRQRLIEKMMNFYIYLDYYVFILI